MVNKIFGALAANIGSGSADGGLSSIAVYSLHGCYGNSFHIFVRLVAGFTGGLLCDAGSVSCFWVTSGIRDGRRSAATAEAVSVCVGHGQHDRSGVRRRSRILSPETDAEDSFDSRHVQHHWKDVRIFERPIQRSSKSRPQQQVWHGSTGGTNLF